MEQQIASFLCEWVNVVHPYKVMRYDSITAEFWNWWY